MRKRISYSQNFLTNKDLISNLIENSSINKNDTVIEIGAGEGIITEELLKVSKKIIAFEIDKTFFNQVQNKFQNTNELELINSNFLNYQLPTTNYKVFANIPFNITSAIIKKLTENENAPDDIYLIVQKESAERFAGKPFSTKNSQISILLKPWFNFEVLYEFKKSDFFPKPTIDSVLLRIQKLETPLIQNVDKNIYQDFIVYTFNQPKQNITRGLSKIFNKQTNIAQIVGFKPNVIPSQLEFEYWLKLFNLFLKESDNKILVKGAFEQIKKQQNKLDKIHRTRVDKNWKKF